MCEASHRSDRRRLNNDLRGWAPEKLASEPGEAFKATLAEFQEDPSKVGFGPAVGRNKRTNVPKWSDVCVRFPNILLRRIADASAHGRLG
jgi:hypothetical protein